MNGQPTERAATRPVRRSNLLDLFPHDRGKSVAEFRGTKKNTMLENSYRPLLRIEPGHVKLISS